VRICVVSTYELGRPSFEAAELAALLSGEDVAHRDLSRGDDLEPGAAPWDALVFLVPMHTATRLALPEIERARARFPGARLFAAGLYAPLTRARLIRAGVDDTFGPEAERDLVRALRGAPRARSAIGGRVRFVPPDRRVHGRLHRFARLVDDGRPVVTGATQSTRGCKHRCRHCPLVPVYQGALRAIPVDVVMADIERQVARGARHITLTDPDFLNAPTHAARVLDGLESRFPELSFDLTAKVEHLRDQPRMLERLARSRCRFVTTAVESFDDDALAVLDKGHTRADFLRVLGRAREVGLDLNPTFLPFAPWTTLDGYARFLDELAQHDLLALTAPVQLCIRLLVPAGSLLTGHEAVAPHLRPLDDDALAHPWSSPDPRVDALQAALEAAVASTDERGEQLEAALDVAAAALGRTFAGRAASCTVPYLEEPWYC
jgi:hypothetical protein